MHDRNLNLKIGNYVFVSYARKDQSKIFKTGIIHRLLHKRCFVVIDEGWNWGWTKDELYYIYSFKAGAPWSNQIEMYARQAGCMLALCSKNTRERLDAQGDNSWIAKELRIGAETGSLLPLSIDADLRLTGDKSFWEKHLGIGFDRKHMTKIGEAFELDQKQPNRHFGDHSRSCHRGNL